MKQFAFIKTNFAIIFSLLLICIGANTVFGKESVNIDELVQKQIEEQKIPGASVAVFQNGKMLVLKGYGFENLETKAPASPDTVYEIASLTKQFTAAGVMLLVEEGKIGLDEPVGKYLEELPEKWRSISVRQLLNHTSGIKNYTAVSTFNNKQDYKREEIVRLVAEDPLDFAPGTSWNYSNTNYFLLGLLIEKLSGAEYGEFLKKKIFEPLGMNSTRINKLNENLAHRAQGYTLNKDGATKIEANVPSQSFAAGALLSTVSDLAKWDAALNAEKVLRRSSLDEMFKQATLPGGKPTRYGFGWGVSKYRGLDFVGHSGGIAGFSSNITRFTNDKLTVIVMANLGGRAAEKMALDIAALYIPTLAQAPAQPSPSSAQPIVDTDEATTKLLREVVDKIAAGNADPNAFTTDMQAKFFPDKIQQLKGLFTSQGEIKSFELMEEEKMESGRRRTYRLSFANLKMRFGFILTPENKIGGIIVKPE